ncbi:MAG: F0F1 ATP synthase subunit B [Pseudomonadota bacterium]
MNINISLIGQMITFILLVILLRKYLYGPLSAVMAERRRKIAEGLEAAERGKNEQNLAEKRAAELLHDAKQRAAEIVAAAEKRSNEIREEAKGVARQEAEQIIAAARAEVEQEVNRAKTELRAKVAQLAVEGAERILAKEIDEKAHAQLLERMAAQL